MKIGDGGGEDDSVSAELMIPHLHRDDQVLVHRPHLDRAVCVCRFIDQLQTQQIKVFKRIDLCIRFTTV